MGCTKMKKTTPLELSDCLLWHEVLPMDEKKEVEEYKPVEVNV